MNINEKSIKRITQLSLLRSVVILFASVVLITFYFDPIDSESNFFIILLFCLIYLILSRIYFSEQINLWKGVRKYRFLSWYYISFSIVTIIVLLAMSLISYFLFKNITFASLTFVLFIVESIGLWINYKHALHFIAVYPEYILIVKKKIQIIYPENIAEIYYRNDILIFKLKNEKTVFINFLEITNADAVRAILSEWIEKNNFEKYYEVIQAMRELSNEKEK